MTGTFDNNKEYSVVQRILENDTRSFEERFAELPCVRVEDYNEWKEWAERTFPHASAYVNNYR